MIKPARRPRQRRAVKRSGISLAAVIAILCTLSLWGAASIRWERPMTSPPQALRLDSFAIYGGGIHIVHGRDIPPDHQPSGFSAGCSWGENDRSRWWFDAHHPQGFYYLFIPLWIAALAAAAPAAWIMRRDYTRAHAGDCAQCGYDLAGNTSGICPECGLRTTDAPKHRWRTLGRVLSLAALAGALILTLAWAASEHWSARWTRVVGGVRATYSVSSGALQWWVEPQFLPRLGPVPSYYSGEPEGFSVDVRSSSAPAAPRIWRPGLQGANRAGQLPLWLPITLLLLPSAAFWLLDGRRPTRPAPERAQ